MSNKKRNIPRILGGLVVVIFFWYLKDNGYRGLITEVIGIVGLGFVLSGFGMSWTRKSKNKQDALDILASIKNPKNEGKKLMVNDAEEYASTAMYMSAKTADTMEKQYKLTKNQGSEIMVQIFAFCVLNLMRRFKSESITPSKGRAFIDDIIRTVAKKAGDREESAYMAYGTMIGELSSKFGELPLSHAGSDKQGGTFLWEYAKHMNKTMGKEELDLEMIIHNMSIITRINDTLDTSHIVKMLK